jgi:hypothetical protein
MWSEFTTNNYLLLSKKELINNNILIKKMKKERNIIYLLPDIIYNITNIELPLDIIYKLADTKFVYKNGLIKNINKLDIQVKIEWNNNIIYLNTTKHKYNKIDSNINL